MSIEKKIEAYMKGFLIGLLSGFTVGLPSLLKVLSDLPKEASIADISEIELLIVAIQVILAAAMVWIAYLKESPFSTYSKADSENMEA